MYALVKNKMLTLVILATVLLFGWQMVFAQQAPMVANAGVVCTDTGGVLTLNNPNDTPVTVKVTASGWFGASINLGVDGDAAQGRLTALANGTYTITTSVTGGAVIAAYQVTVSCNPAATLPNPDPEMIVGATVTAGCATSGVFITADNSNDEAVLVRVTGPNGYSREAMTAVAAESNFTALRNGIYAVMTWTAAGTVQVDGQAVPITCPGGTVSISGGAAVAVDTGGIVGGIGGGVDAGFGGMAK